MTVFSSRDSQSQALSLPGYLAYSQFLSMNKFMDWLSYSHSSKNTETKSLSTLNLRRFQWEGMNFVSSKALSVQCTSFLQLQQITDLLFKI